MPIKTKYELKCIGKPAAIVTTYDRFYAEAEMEKEQRKAPMGTIFQLIPTIEVEQPLTRDEQYLLLVKDTLSAIRRYYDCGRRNDDLKASLALESQLDKWNRTTRAFIDGHPGFEDAINALPSDNPRRKHFSFFIIVEKWRTAWHEYFTYKKRKDKDPLVESQIKKKCFELENVINSYIKQTLQL